MSNSFVELGLVEEEVIANSIEKNEINLNEFNKPVCFVAVHIGAGFHSESKTDSYKQLCENICKEIIKLLDEGMPSKNAVAKAVALLEVVINDKIFFLLFN